MTLRRTSSLLSRGGRFGGFIAVPLISALSPLIALPAITRNFGADGWASVALGQSFGAAVAVLLELGWGLTGPQRVARQARHNRRQTFVLALATKSVVAVPAVAVAMLAASALAPSAAVTASWSAAAAALAGFSAGWYFIGVGRPGPLVLSDTLPRVAAAVGAAIAIDLGAPLVLYPVALLVAALAAVLAGAVIAGAHLVAWRPLLAPARLLLVGRAQLLALGGRAISSLYIALPVAIVGVAAPHALALFAAIERLQRMGLTVLSSVPNAMQAWVGSGRGSERPRRVRSAVLLNAFVGLTAGAAVGIGLPIAAPVLFSGVVTVTPLVSWWSGLLVAIVCTSRAVGLLGLVSYRRIGAIASSAAVGAVVGITGIWLGSRAFGAVGGLLGEVLAEAAVLTVQVLALTRAMNVASRARTRPTAEGVLL